MMEVNISGMVIAVCATVTQIAQVNIACFLQIPARYMTKCGHANCLQAEKT